MEPSIAASVGVGSCVIVRDLRNHDEFPITIHPGDDAAGPESVAPQSAIGRALLGAQVDEIVSWATPQGPASFRVIAIHPEEQP